MARSAILGAGAWGTALSLVLAEHGEEVSLWTWLQSHAERMRAERTNQEFFPGFELPSNVLPTASLKQALDGVDLIVLALPSHVLRQTLTQVGPEFGPSQFFVSATKGIENDSLLLMSEVAREVLGPSLEQRFTILSGPSFAAEVARGIPTNVVLAGRDDQLVDAIQVRLASERFRVYSSDDVMGVQLGGALKNVMAIAAGTSDGLGFGHNSRAALITRGIAEMTRLAVRCGGNPLTLAGLSGIGDLVLTCTGELSRNRTVGLQLGRGVPLEQVLAELGHVAEGVTTTKSAYHLARRLDVDMPITTEVYRVLFEGKCPRVALRDLASRPLRRELD